jgi:hypothetical protein
MYLEEACMFPFTWLQLGFLCATLVSILTFARCAYNTELAKRSGEAKGYLEFSPVWIESHVSARQFFRRKTRALDFVSTAGMVSTGGLIALSFIVSMHGNSWLAVAYFVAAEIAGFVAYSVCLCMETRLTNTLAEMGAPRRKRPA